MAGNAGYAAEGPVRSPIDTTHAALSARMVPFAGFLMPLQYAGILKEHAATLQTAGVFDVSHMGQVTLHGDPHSAALWLEQLAPSAFTTLKPGAARYSVLTNEAGGIIDDFIALRLPDRLMLVVNGARREAVAHHFETHASPSVTAVFEDRALIALQGPDAETILAPHASGITDLAFMEGRETIAFGVPAVVTRSGYTGQDGFEISLPPEIAANAFQRLTERATPAGLGARDVLRLEAGLPLYGQDLTETISPVEAGLAFTVAKSRREAGGFLGADTILKELRDGPRRKRVGLNLDGRVPARAGASVRQDDSDVGEVTSGAHSPRLGHPIALALVNADAAAPGTQLQAVVRDRPIPATVTTVPFLPHATRRRAKH